MAATSGGMLVPFGNLQRHYQVIRAEVDAAVQRTLESGWYILGREVTAFEEEFARFCGVRYAVGAGNGTEAIQLALAALNLEPGAEVITTANAGVPGVVAILQAGLRPVLVDVEEGSQNMDAARLEAAITMRTRAVMPVHLFGRTADLGAIQEVARRHGLYLVEDCAQAHGAHYQGRLVGSYGHLGCFSFYPTKNLGCFGDGGMVITDDPALAERVRQLHTYGWSRKYYSAIPGGINSRLDELQAAILRAKLPHLEEWNRTRQERARWYDAALAGAQVQVPEVAPPGREHVYHLYVVRSSQRDALRDHLRRRGIGTDVHYPLPSHLHPAFASLGYRPGDLPVSEKLAGQVLSLPMYPELSRDEVETVAAAIKAFAMEDHQ